MQLKRIMLLLGLLGAAFAGLGYRLVDLQVLRHGELSVKAEQNTQREYWIAPRRGDILDVNGNLLAGSVPVGNGSVACDLKYSRPTCPSAYDNVLLLLCRMVGEF